MRKAILYSFLAVLCLIAFGGSALAWDSELDGRPRQFSTVGKTGYYVWQDEHGFHLWTLPGDGSHTFIGAIRTDGRIFDLRGHHIESGAAFYVYPDIQTNFWFEAASVLEADRAVGPGLEVDYQPNRLVFRFAGSDAYDGLRFRISGGSYVNFELQMDGKGLDRRNIWIGENGWHPDSYNFRYKNK